MKTKNRTKKMFKIALVVLGVISLCFVLSTCIAVMLTPDEEIVLVEVTATPTISLVVTTAYNATNEAMILATPSLTPTTVPAVTPTATPIPTVMSTAIPETREESQYHVEMPRLMDRYIVVFSTVGSLSGQAGTDPNLLRDTRWREDIAQALAEMLLVGFEVRALEPPPHFEKTHELLSQATVHFDASVYLLADGIDNLDPSLFTQAAEEIALGTELIEQATEALPDSY